MFRIAELLIEDKHLPTVLHRLAGLVLDMKPPQPVINATVKGGKVVAASSGDPCEMFHAHLGKQKITSVTPKLMQDFCEQIGRARTSYSHLLKCGQNAGFIGKRKGTGRSTAYPVLIAHKKGVKHG